MRIRNLTAIASIIFISAPVASQTFLNPNFALKSHETLDITKFEITPEKTTISLSIENRIEGGNFCADRNIYIIYPDGSRLRLTKAVDIPVCPYSYKFRTIGERLNFNLIFPSLKPATEWIDLVEECNDNCFSFYGVTLNIDLNNKMDEAFALAEKGEISKSIELYKNILQSIESRNYGIEGALYTNIISLSFKSGDEAGAEEWYKKMLKSKILRLDLCIKNLNMSGIKF